MRHSPGSALVATYAIGFFSLSLEPMFGLLIPLWALKLKVGSLMIGIIVGGSALLPTLLSIPLGGLVDRIGARTVIIGASAGTAACIALYPLTSVVTLLALHMVVGLLSSFLWISAQTYVAKLGSDQGRAQLMGQFSSATTLGTFVGPLFVGYLLDTWDFTFTFLASSAWGLMAGLAAVFLPTIGPTAAPDWSRLRPRFEDYARAASLLKIPAVRLVMLGTVLRLATYAIRSSYYPVYLIGIAYPAFSIGILNSSSSLAGVFSALSIGWLCRRVQAPYLLLSTLTLAIVPLAITPAFSGFWHLLLLSAVSGAAIGVTLPLLLSILANATGTEVRGLTAGLRTAANRFSFLVVPVLLGVSIDRVGLSAGFYLVGLLLMLGVAGLAVYIQLSYRRAPSVKSS